MPRWGKLALSNFCAFSARVAEPRTNPALSAVLNPFPFINKFLAYYG